MSGKASAETVVNPVFFQLAVPRELVGEVHTLLWQRVMQCITTAGKQSSLDSASYFLEQGKAWELMRDSVCKYMKAVGDWVDD